MSRIYFIRIDDVVLVRDFGNDEGGVGVYLRNEIQLECAESYAHVKELLREKT